MGDPPPPIYPFIILKGGNEVFEVRWQHGAPDSHMSLCPVPLLLELTKTCWPAPGPSKAAWILEIYHKGLFKSYTWKSM